MFCVELASSSHIEQIIQCHDYAVMSEDGYTSQQKEAWMWGRHHASSLQTYIDSNSHIVAIARSMAGNTVGFIVLDVRQAECLALYVLLKRHGIGTLLLGFGVQYFPETFTVLSNTGSSNFYRKLGFKVLEEGEFILNGVRFDVEKLIYEKNGYSKKIL